MIVSLLVSLLVFYGVSFLLIKFNSVSYIATLSQQIMFPASQASSPNDVPWYSVTPVVATHLVSITMTGVLGVIICKRLPEWLRYELYIGFLVLSQPFIRLRNKVWMKFWELRGLPQTSDSDSGEQSEDGESDGESYEDARIRAEILNFCLSLPKESEKWALAAAIKVRRKQEEKINNYNKLVERLESQGTDVSADKLDENAKRLGDPFAEGVLDMDLLKRYDISLTNYVPYLDRIEKDRPWYPSLVAARRESFKKRFRENVAGIANVRKDEDTSNSEEGHFYLQVGRRHSETSLAGFSSQSTQLTDIIGSIGGTTKTSSVIKVDQQKESKKSQSSSSTGLDMKVPRTGEHQDVSDSSSTDYGRIYEPIYGGTSTTTSNRFYSLFSEDESNIMSKIQMAQEEHVIEKARRTSSAHTLRTLDDLDSWRPENVQVATAAPIEAKKSSAAPVSHVPEIVTTFEPKHERDEHTNPNFVISFDSVPTEPDPEMYNQHETMPQSDSEFLSMTPLGESMMLSNTNNSMSLNPTDMFETETDYPTVSNFTGNRTKSAVFKSSRRPRRVLSRSTSRDQIRASTGRLSRSGGGVRRFSIAEVFLQKDTPKQRSKLMSKESRSHLMMSGETEKGRGRRSRSQTLGRDRSHVTSSHTKYIRDYSRLEDSTMHRSQSDPNYIYPMSSKPNRVPRNYELDMSTRIPTAVSPDIGLDVARVAGGPQSSLENNYGSEANDRVYSLFRGRTADSVDEYEADILESSQHSRHISMPDDRSVMLSEKDHSRYGHVRFQENVKRGNSPYHHKSESKDTPAILVQSESHKMLSSTTTKGSRRPDGGFLNAKDRSPFNSSNKGSFQGNKSLSGDYRVLPDYPSSPENSGKATEDNQRPILHIAQEVEYHPPKFRLIEFDEELNEWRKTDVLDNE